MVSISSVGKIFNAPVKFNANPTNNCKQNDKESLRNFAQNQVNLGYGVIAAGAVAVAGSLAKSKSVRAIAAVPAALISASMGINMLSSGKAIQKEVETTTETKPQQQPTAEKA